MCCSRLGISARPRIRRNRVVGRACLPIHRQDVSEPVPGRPRLFVVGSYSDVRAHRLPSSGNAFFLSHAAHSASVEITAVGRPHPAASWACCGDRGASPTAHSHHARSWGGGGRVVAVVRGNGDPRYRTVLGGYRVCALGHPSASARIDARASGVGRRPRTPGAVFRRPVGVRRWDDGAALVLLPDGSPGSSCLDNSLDRARCVRRLAPDRLAAVGPNDHGFERHYWSELSITVRRGSRR